jgi:hypothetical protein
VWGDVWIGNRGFSPDPQGTKGRRLDP